MDVFIISAAYSGFGRSICEVVAEKFPNSTLILHGRHSDQINALISSLTNFKGNIVPLILDLSEIVENEFYVENCVQNCLHSDVTSVYLFNNAGTSKPMQFLPNCSASSIADAVLVNVTASIIFTNAVIRACSSMKVSSLKIINISSLCALVAFPSMATYCIGKSARDMHMKSISAEHQTKECKIYNEISRIRTLNYAPGAMKTNMGLDCANNCASSSLREAYATKTKFVEALASARVLLNILERDDFEDGQHIDIFDEIPN